MSTQQTSSSSGIGFIGLLTIVFIILKLLGKVSWSWIWVLSPIWITTCIAICIIVGGGILAIKSQQS